jgi:predicted amidohydrolase
MSKITVSLGQINIQLGNVEKNLDVFDNYVTEAARRGSELVMFPELWSTGYVLSEAHQHASVLGEATFARIADAAHSHHITIIGSIMEKRGDEVANSAAVISPDGEILAVYRKVHLFRLFEEEKYLQEGDAPVSLDMPWAKIGLAICYDLRFPELFRRYTVHNGVRVLVIPAEWPLVRIEHWRALLIARAIENQCYVIGCNSAGQSGQTVFGGHSMIVDPWGKIVVEAGETPQLITAEIELDTIDEARSKIPVFEDIREDIYGRESASL